jgi:hypothetical protein
MYGQSCKHEHGLSTPTSSGDVPDVHSALHFSV